MVSVMFVQSRSVHRYKRLSGETAEECSEAFLQFLDTVESNDDSNWDDVEDSEMGTWETPELV